MTTGPTGPTSSGWKNWTTQGSSTVSTPNAPIGVDPLIAELVKLGAEEILRISTLLKNAGYISSVTRKYNKALGDAYLRANQEWLAESARSGRPNLNLEAFLKENQVSTGDGAKTPKVPTRQIYAASREQIDADVNEIALSRLGRQLTDVDRQADWYKDLIKTVKKMYNAGVLSEPSKIVKNKETGKMERIVKQTPQFSKEGITTAITEAVEAADPVSLERKKNLDFANWAFQKMGGRG